MPLIENTLWGPVDKVAVAIERLRMFEPAEGYWLAFSGGKDSQTVYHLAQLAGVRFTAHFSLTTVDPPELLRFIRQQYPDVIWERPKKTMWELIVSHGSMPLRYARFCCEHLKEIHGMGTIVTGIRWQESTARSKRHMTETCANNPGKNYLHPIIDWATDDVWAFLDSEQLPHCNLYDEGWRRIGCILCPMATPAERQRARERWPKYYDSYKRAAGRMIAAMREHGREPRRKTADELMYWWINDTAIVSEAQQELPGIMV